MSIYKTCHKAKNNEKGKVTALCYKDDRPINLMQVTWTNRNEAVTCEKCKNLLGINKNKYKYKGFRISDSDDGFVDVLRINGYLVEGGFINYLEAEEYIRTIAKHPLHD